MLGKPCNWDYQWAQIVGRAWADGNFKQRLFENPLSVLQEYELELPPDRRVQVLDDEGAILEDCNDVHYLLLPARPSDDELSDDDLVSAGGAVAVERCGWCHRCHRCYCGWCHHPPKPDDD